ncbi:MAG: nuclear transport factor 2 family protein [Pyrinomonadaceae bacterium]
MKQFVLLIMLMAITAGIAFGQCSAEDKKMFEAYDRSWGTAGETGDKAKLMDIYADDYTGMPGMLNKMTTIDNTMKAFERNKTNSNRDKTTHEIYRISCTPNSATITHRNTIWSADGPGGKPETFYTRSVHFLEKRGGKWQVVSNAGSGLDDYDVLWYLEQAWNDAAMSSDKKWFEDNYASDFSSISSTSGALTNRVEELASIGKDKITSAETTDMNIRMEGNAAVINGVYHIKGTDEKGAAFDHRMRYTDTWIKRDGRWQAWASQGTLIK